MNRTAASALADADLVVFVVEAHALLRGRRSGPAAHPRIGTRIHRRHQQGRPDLSRRTSCCRSWRSSRASTAFSTWCRCRRRRASISTASSKSSPRACPNRPNCFRPSSAPTAATISRSPRPSARSSPWSSWKSCRMASRSRSRRRARMDGQLVIDAVIWVDRAGQKPIVIGAKGSRLKRIGQQAREELNARLGQAPASQSVGQGARGLGRRRARAGAARHGVETMTVQPRERIALEPAFVLHHREYRDTSRILDVFTAQARPADAVRARRARAEIEARLAAHAVPAAAGVVDGPRRCRAAHGRGVRRRSAAVAAAPGALRLLSQRAHHQPHHAARSAAAAVRRLRRRRCAGCASTPRPSTALRVFEKRLLASIGYGLEFDVDAERLLSIPRRRRAVRGARRRARRLSGPLPAGAAAGSAGRRASRSTSRAACCARRWIIVWKAASFGRARWRARCRGEEMHEHSITSNSASTSITWPRCGRRAACPTRIPCMPRCSPSRPAPTTSRCICAKTAATSRIATCMRCGRCCRRA